MSKPLDAYDLHLWAKDSKQCWELAISEIRLRGLISGEYQPIDGEKDWRWTW